jgi:predicted ATPase
VRIVVSGTHASGKSTLIADFARRHPEYAVFADPFELIDESDDRPAAAMFASVATRGRPADRSRSGEKIIAERGPLDFLAYLLALDELGPRRSTARRSQARLTARDEHWRRSITSLCSR